MSSRSTIFASDEYYHIFNRGVDKREVFLCAQDYDRFLISMELLNDQHDGLMIEWRDYKKANPKNSLNDFLKGTFRKRVPLVEIVAYCLNPNHYHFILKQLTDRGIEKFLHKIGTSHTKYFNKKNKRSGALFQGTFKSVHINSNEQLLYLSAYVNKNNYIHGYINNNTWPYSSASCYLKNTNDTLIKNRNTILEQFDNNKNTYSKFLADTVLHFKEKKGLEKYLIED